MVEVGYTLKENKSDCDLYKVTAMFYCYCTRFMAEFKVISSVLKTVWVDLYYYAGNAILNTAKTLFEIN